MTLFVVTYVHPDAEAWAKHAIPHVHYLQDILKSGKLIASGPFNGAEHKSAMLIMSAENREELMAVIERDPFWIEGLVHDMIITEWDPFFGAFNALSSRPAAD